MVVGLSIGGLVNGGWFRPGRGLVDQQGIPGEARVPLAALGVEDPEGRPTPRRTVAVVRDERLGALADDVAAQADPRPAGQLEPNAGRLGDCGREPAGESRRIEDQQQGLRPPGECGESMESIGDPARFVGPGQSTAREVEDEEVDRAAGEKTAGDAQALVEAGRGDDDEPLEVDSPGDGLDRIEAARQIEPGDDRALRLRLRGDPQAERGPAAGAVAADRDTGRLREAAGAEDRVERGEAGADDAVVGSRVVLRLEVGCLDRRGGQSQGSDHPRSCGTPSSPEARDGSIHITTPGRHRTPRIEQMF
jgi:hypothetical protein